MSDDGKTKLTGYLWLPDGRGPHPAVVMMHGRHGAYSSLAHGVYDAQTLTKRHKMWGEFWAETAEHEFDDPGNKKQSVPANRKAKEDSMRRAEAFFARYLKP